jgi:aminoglycoside phosphotransferase (APT) family kinase protein
MRRIRYCSKMDLSQAADRPDRTTVEFVMRSGLVPPGAAVRFERLPGGVSSDIWLVRAGDAQFCVKRALPQLRVAQIWQAPVERNEKEAAWFRAVSQVLPAVVPGLIAADGPSGIFAMRYLPPDAYKNWKEELRESRVDAAFAAAVGRSLATVHGAFAGSPEAAREFATDATFEAIRIEPYLRAAARAHPDLAAPLQSLAATTKATKLTLVHGDVSPKNILVGPRGPVFIDAECAWYGDPAFDLAFCLNHLLLKCRWVPEAAPKFLGAFERLAANYLAGVTWEPRERIEARAARLLPGLFLARIDGKSPVEYLTCEADKELVRRTARALLADPPAYLADIAGRWAREIGL